MQLGANDWSKFQEHVQKLHAAEICQKDRQINPKKKPQQTTISLPQKYP